MKRCRLFLLTALCAFSALPARAERAHDELWSLYVLEQASQVCGFEVSEDQENALDEAQHRTRVQLSVSREQAAELYRRARDRVISAQREICTDAPGLELGWSSLRRGPG